MLIRVRLQIQMATHHFESHCAVKEAPLTKKGATVAKRDTATGDSPHLS